MKVKKFLSLTLIVVLLFNSIHIFSFATGLNNDNSNKISIDDFEDLLSDMLNQYDFTLGSVTETSGLLKNRLIVKTNDNNPLTETFDAIDIVEGYGGLHILQYLTESQAEYAFNCFLKSNIEYVEYDVLFEIASEEDTNYDYSKKLSWNSETSDVLKAFDYIENNGVVCQTVEVAIIDSGIYIEHEHFETKDPELFRIIDSGYALSYGTTTFPSIVDDVNHGTHVAGIIYDNTINNIIIKPYRVFIEANFASGSMIYTCFQKAVEHGVDIINMSLCGSAEAFKTLNDAIENASNKGIVIVVAAGNENDDACSYSPACCESAITVSATNIDNKPATEYSNWGSCVDIAAPGTKINSTVPRYWTKTDEKLNSSHVYEATPKSLYKEMTGTSQATPLVSAAAALIKSIDPDITPAEVKRIIKETAFVPDDWEESCDGKNYGTGIVNFYNIARAMLGESESQTPEIEITLDNKFKITTPEGSDSRIYYTLDGTIPTIENHLTYTEPLSLRNTYTEKLTVVCHENGKLIGDSVSYDMITNKSENLFYRYSDNLSDGAKFKNAYWSSYNPDIVSVDKDGSISANSVGTTKITCRLQTGEQIVWNIKVRYTPLQSFFVLFFFGFLWL